MKRIKEQTGLNVSSLIKKDKVLIRDITLKIDPTFKVSKNSEPLRVEKTRNIASHGFVMSKLSMGTHVGTHLDSPLHFLQDGLTISEISLDILIGKVFLINLSYKNDKESIKISDLEKFEKDISNAERIIIRTDWSKFYRQKKYYSDFPRITRKLVSWLAKREVKLIGLESPSLNIEDNLNVHKFLLSRNILIIESLANLDGLDSGEFFMICLPLKIERLEASPVRVVLIY